MAQPLQASLDNAPLAGPDIGGNAPAAGSTGTPPGRPTGNPRRTLRRLVAATLLVALLAFGLGFVVFAQAVTSARPPADPEADGIVALTGGPGRIEDAAELLERGSAGRLLISGVNQRTSAEAIAERSAGVAGLMSCCIDIGYEARDTRGNAAEAAKWANERGYRSLIVVTSAYHMPRSLSEMNRALPDVELVAYPVPPADEVGDDWRSDLATFQLLVSEYLKYIVTRFA